MPMNIGAHFRLQTKYWCMWHTLRFQVSKALKLTDAKIRDGAGAGDVMVS